MQYRSDKHGNMLSILGYGCMRFTKKGNSIDIDKAEQEILAAYRATRPIFIPAARRRWERSLRGTGFGRKSI